MTSPGRTRLDLGELSSGFLRSLTAALPPAVDEAVLELIADRVAAALAVESEQMDGRCCLAWRSDALGQCPDVRDRAPAAPQAF